MVVSRKHQIDVLCVISENEYKRVCTDYGFDWVMTENTPVGRKINYGFSQSLKYDYDYLMVMNSDSVIDSKLLDEVYEPFFESLNPFFGINRITYVNFLTKQARDFTYEFSVLGVGKCIHRSVVEKLPKPYPERNRGLDDGMMDTLIHAGYWPTIVPYEGQLAWDFKSEVNIHPWREFENRGKEVCYSRA
jgi:hypothetical protein